jgi:predicted nucleic-acid-binding protein
MRAVDTNIFARLITDDDPDQAATAHALLAAGPIWISKTVLLETNWVLKRAYEMSPIEIHEAFTRILGATNVYTEDKAMVFEALALILQGVEFPDAIHLASRPAGTEFFTFDRTFIKRAKRAGVARISDASIWRSH